MKRRVLERTFQGKFHLIPTEGTSHRLYYKIHRGQEIYQIPVSRTHTDITDNIMRQMAVQCFLQLGEFKKAVDCTYTKDEFDSLTIQRWRERYSRGEA